MDIRTEVQQLITDLGVPAIVSELLISLIIIILWLFAGIVIVKLVRRSTKRFIEAKTKSTRTVTVIKLLTSVFRYTIWFMVFLSILKELNVDVTPILASAGVLGLAIGFGSQEMIKDFIAGFFIIFEGSFDVGDVIEVAGFKGTVTSLGLRTTKIKNWKGEIKTITNGDCRGVINFSKENSVAIIEFGVAYDTDLEKLKKVVTDLFPSFREKYEDIVEEPNFLGIHELADSSINLTLIAKTKPTKHFQVQRDIRRELVEAFRKNGIEIPFPQVVVHQDE